MPAFVQAEVLSTKVLRLLSPKCCFAEVRSLLTQSRAPFGVVSQTPVGKTWMNTSMHPSLLRLGLRSCLQLAWSGQAVG